MPRSLSLSLLALLCCAALPGPDGDENAQPPWRAEEVEISPGQFLRVEWRSRTLDDPGNADGDEWTRLRTVYRGKTPVWTGAAIPFILREHDGRLYLVGFDRETERRAWERKRGEARPAEWRMWYRYYRQEDERFVEIRPAEFPKQIATQNMWFTNARDLAAARALDTGSVDFQHSWTAYVWLELLTGRVQYRGGVDKVHLDEYRRTFEPVRLPTIKREAATTRPSDRTRRRAAAPSRE